MSPCAGQAEQGRSTPCYDAPHDDGWRLHVSGSLRRRRCAETVAACHLCRLAVICHLGYCCLCHLGHLGIMSSGNVALVPRLRGVPRNPTRCVQRGDSISSSGNTQGNGGAGVVRCSAHLRALHRWQSKLAEQRLASTSLS